MTQFDQVFGAGGQLSAELRRIYGDERGGGDQPYDRSARATIDRLMPEPWWDKFRDTAKDNVDAVLGNPYDAAIAVKKTFGSHLPPLLRDRFSAAVTRGDMAETTARYKAEDDAVAHMRDTPNRIIDDLSGPQTAKVDPTGIRPTVEPNFFDRWFNEELKQLVSGDHTPAAGGLLGKEMIAFSRASRGKGLTDVGMDLLRKIGLADDADRLSGSLVSQDPAHVADNLRAQADANLKEAGSDPNAQALGAWGGAALAGGVRNFDPVAMLSMPGSMLDTAMGMSRAAAEGKDPNPFKNPLDVTETLGSLGFGVLTGHAIPALKKIAGKFAPLEERVTPPPIVDNPNFRQPVQFVEPVVTEPVVEAAPVKTVIKEQYTEPVVEAPPADSELGTKPQPKEKPKAGKITAKPKVEPVVTQDGASEIQPSKFDPRLAPYLSALEDSRKAELLKNEKIDPPDFDLLHERSDAYKEAGKRVTAELVAAKEWMDPAEWRVIANKQMSLTREALASSIEEFKNSPSAVEEFLRVRGDKDDAKAAKAWIAKLKANGYDTTAIEDAFRQYEDIKREVEDALPPDGEAKPVAPKAETPPVGGAGKTGIPIIDQALKDLAEMRARAEAVDVTSVKSPKAKGTIKANIREIPERLAAALAPMLGKIQEMRVTQGVDNPKITSPTEMEWSRRVLGRLKEELPVIKADFTESLRGEGTAPDLYTGDRFDVVQGKEQATDYATGAVTDENTKTEFHIVDKHQIDPGTGEPKVVARTYDLTDANDKAQAHDISHAIDQAESAPEVVNPDGLDPMREHVQGALDQYLDSLTEEERASFGGEIEDAIDNASTPDELQKIHDGIQAQISAENVHGEDGSVTPPKKRPKSSGGTILLGDKKALDTAVKGTGEFFAKHKVSTGIGAGLVGVTAYQHFAPQETKDFVQNQLVPTAIATVAFTGAAYLAGKGLMRMEFGELSAAKALGKAEKLRSVAAKWKGNVVTPYKELVKIAGQDLANEASQVRDLKKKLRAVADSDMDDFLKDHGVISRDNSGNIAVPDREKVWDLGLMEDPRVPFYERGAKMLGNKIRAGVKDQFRNPIVNRNMSTLLTNAAVVDDPGGSVTHALNGVWFEAEHLERAKAAVDGVKEVTGVSGKPLSARKLAAYKSVAKDYLEFKAMSKDQQPFAEKYAEISDHPVIKESMLVSRTGRDIKEIFDLGRTGELKVQRVVNDPKTGEFSNYEDRYIYGYMGDDGKPIIKDAASMAEVGSGQGEPVRDTTQYATTHLLDPRRNFNTALHEQVANLIAKVVQPMRILGERPTVFGVSKAAVAALNIKDPATAVAALRNVPELTHLADEELEMYHQLIRDTLARKVEQGAKGLLVTESNLQDLTIKLSDYIERADVIGPSAVKLHRAQGLQLPAWAYDFEYYRSAKAHSYQIADTLAYRDTWGQGLTKLHDQLNSGVSAGKTGYLDKAYYLVNRIVESSVPQTEAHSNFNRYLSGLRGLNSGKTFFNPGTTSVAQLGATAEVKAMGYKPKGQFLGGVKRAAQILRADYDPGYTPPTESVAGIDDIHGHMAILDRVAANSHWEIDNTFGDLYQMREDLNPSSPETAKAKRFESFGNKVASKVSQATGLHAGDLGPRRLMATDGGMRGANDALMQIAYSVDRHGWDMGKLHASEAYHWLHDMVRYTHEDIVTQANEIVKRGVAADVLWQDPEFSKYGDIAYAFGDRAHVTGDVRDLPGVHWFRPEAAGAYRTFMQFKTFQLGRSRNLADALAKSMEQVADAHQLYAAGEITRDTLKQKSFESMAPFWRQAGAYTGHGLLQIGYKALVYGMLHELGAAVQGHQSSSEPYPVKRLKQLVSDASAGLIKMSASAQDGDTPGMLQRILAPFGAAGQVLMHDSGYLGIIGDLVPGDAGASAFTNPVTYVATPALAQSLTQPFVDFMSENASRHKLEESGDLESPGQVMDAVYAGASALARAVPVTRHALTTKQNNFGNANKKIGRIGTGVGKSVGKKL